MPDQAPRQGLSRREIMERAIVLVGGAAALSVGACSPSAGPFFSGDQMSTLTRVVDVIIPETDTPGAVAAGVPAFMDSMMVNWASRETRGKFANVLSGIDARAREAHDARFTVLTPEQQVEIVRAYDAAEIFNDNGEYRGFKQLVLLGYYHSEIGATQELRYELVPGRYDSDVPFAEIGRAWA